MLETEIQTFEELTEKFKGYFFFIMGPGSQVLEGIKCDRVEVREPKNLRRVQNELVLHDPSNISKAKQINQTLKENSMSKPKKANVKFVVTKKEAPAKKKAERMPFKNESIKEYLEQKDFVGLEQHLLQIKDAHEEFKAFMSEVEGVPALLVEYQNFLNAHLVNILKNYKMSSWQEDRNIVSLWAPSQLEAMGLKFPLEAIPYMGLTDLLDDYYHCLYDPSTKNRFGGDPMEVFHSAVKAKCGSIDRQVTVSIGEGQRPLADKSDPEQGALKELIATWGISAVKAWWRGLDEDEVIDLRGHSREEEISWGTTLYQQLVAKFGGGLTEDWVKEWGGSPEDMPEAPEGEEEGRTPIHD